MMPERSAPYERMSGQLGQRGGGDFRPLGNVIHLMRPCCVTSEDLDKGYAVIDEVADIIAATTA